MTQPAARTALFRARSWAGRSWLSGRVRCRERRDGRLRVSLVGFDVGEPREERRVPRRARDEAAKALEFEKAAELGMEASFAKPFCAMLPDPAKPNIAAFLDAAGIGRPSIEVVVQKSREGKDHIVAANVKRSAPCGSTWFVAKRLLGLEPDQPDIRERISEAHHAYPCTASMERDTELGDTILHKGGYIIREEVEDAFKKAKRLD